MITSEELENFDIFPKEYSFSCLFKFIFYSLSSIFSYVLLFCFYTDTDIYSVLTMRSRINQNIIINDYLTNKLIELNPKDFLSKNKTNFIQRYDNLKGIFIKEYVMNSYPCLIKNSSNYFGVREIINITEEKLIKDKNKKILFEYKVNPYTQFYEDDYQYLLTTYDNYLNIRKNNKNNLYFLNEYNLIKSNNNITTIAYDNYLKFNYLVRDLELEAILLSRADNFVVVWGHMEISDQFICLEEGMLEFILVPPQEKKYMYPYSNNGPINYSRVNFFDGKNNKIENYPDFFKSNKIYINLSTDECLYIPAFWWRGYRTNKRNKEKTIFLTFKYISNSKYLENIMYFHNDF